MDTYVRAIPCRYTGGPLDRETYEYRQPLHVHLLSRISETRVVVHIYVRNLKGPTAYDYVYVGCGLDCERGKKMWYEYAQG